MKKMSNTIVFFGSGPVAAVSLLFLANHFPIEAVITKAMPAHHKEAAPVEEIAKNRRLPIFFANTKQELDELMRSHTFHSLLGVLVDYGVIVSKNVIGVFELGIVNSHFSLLPQWRGADPITFSILSGQPKTGVSLMLIDPTLDTGKLITQKALPIRADDTTPSLTKRLIDLSNQLLAEYLPRYISGKVKPKNQPHPGRATYSRKLTKDDGVIDWSKPAEQIEREIRAYVGWPKSRAVLAGKELIVTKAWAVSGQDSQPGKVEVNGKTLLVHTGKGFLSIERLKPAGKNEMDARAFLAGYRI